MSAYLLLIFFFIASLRASAQLQDPTYVGHVCTNRVSRKTNYSSNLQTLLTTLCTNKAFFLMGYRSLAKGQNPDMVFGLYLCKGDLSTEVCRHCVVFAAKDARSRCPGRKEFLIQYDECMLGYSDRSIFVDTVTTTRIITWSTQNVTADQSDRFNDAVRSLMIKCAEEAANSTRMFAVKKSDFTSSRTLYASVQCIPDLSSQDCLSCLQQSISELNFNKVGGRFLVPSCNSRYEVYPFYNETVVTSVLPLPVSPPPLPPGKSSLSLYLCPSFT